MGNCFSTESGGPSHELRGGGILPGPGGPSPGISRLPEVSVPPGLNPDIGPIDLGIPRPLPDPTEATPNSVNKVMIEVFLHSY